MTKAQAHPADAIAAGGDPAGAWIGRSLPSIGLAPDLTDEVLRMPPASA